MKKALVIIAVAITVVAAGACIVVNVIMNRGLPQYSGTVVAAGQIVPGAKVTVYRDADGVSHIVADTEQDAYFALGYVHAQERLFQMDLTRMMASGRLTELIGDAKTDPGMMGHNSLLEQDKFNRLIGLRMLGEKGAKLLTGESKEIIESYCAGINTYIDTAKSLPPEFTLLGRKPEHWTPADVIMLGRLIAWSLSLNMRFEIARLEAVGELGRERGWELFPRYAAGGPYIIDPSIKKYNPQGKVIEPAPVPVPPDVLKSELAVALLRADDANRAALGISGFELASNNWVVSGAHTKSGKPLLANDPHLIHMLPSVFYETHLVTKDGLNVIGVSFPGMPFMTLGHTPTMAWAATTTRCDKQDLFVEKVNPNNPEQYLHTGEWLTFGKREEVFKIKSKGGFRTEKVLLRTTIHGPVINDLLPGVGKDAMPIALAWTGYTLTDDSKGFLAVARARDAAEVKKAFGMIGSPVQNWVFADTKGNIGYFASGLYPARAKGDGTIPVPGWMGDYDWRGFVPYSELPQLDNPKNGIIVTANNAVLPEEDYAYVVSFTYEKYRALRIHQMLGEKKKFTAADFEKMQHDTKSLHAAEVVPVFLASFERAGDKNDPLAVKAAKALKGWDFFCNPDSVGAAVFATAYKAALDLTFGDEVSKELLLQFYETPDVENTTTPMYLTGESSFMDDKKTDRVETRDDILAAAVKVAGHKLAERFGNDPAKWKWGSLHVVTFGHPFGAVKPLRRLFPVYKIPAYGGRGTVFNGHYLWLDYKFPVVAGPCFRQVIDMADVPGARMVIDTGESGHPRMKHFFDQNDKWLNGGMIPMEMDIEKIKRSNEGVLEIVPKR